MLSTLKKINADIMQPKVNPIATPIVNPMVKPRLTNTLPVVTEKTSEEPPIFPNIIRPYPAFPRSLCDYSTLEYIDVKTLIDPEINLYYFN